MSDAPNWDQSRIEFETYKVKVSFRKFVLGSVVTAIVIAAIPSIFNLANAWLASIQSDKERSVKEAEAQKDFLHQLLDPAVSQDIEKRIRLAEYFSSVSSESNNTGWIIISQYSQWSARIFVTKLIKTKWIGLRIRVFLKKT